MYVGGSVEKTQEARACLTTQDKTLESHTPAGPEDGAGRLQMPLPRWDSDGSGCQSSGTWR